MRKSHLISVSVAVAAAFLLSRTGRADEAPAAGSPPAFQAETVEVEVFDTRMDVRTDVGAANPRQAQPVLVTRGGPCAPQTFAPPCFDGGCGGGPLLEGAFEEVSSYEVLSNPRSEIREAIWATPEDFVTPIGESSEQGIAYIPFWARNVIRVGKAQLFPFAEVQGIYHSNYFESSRNEREVFEVAATAGFLGEYLFSGGHTRVKAGGRVTYHTYDDGELDDQWTGVGGAAIEHQLCCNINLEAGVEYERTLCNVIRSHTLSGGKKDDGHDDKKGDDKKDHGKKDDVDFEDHDIEERETLAFFGNARWDRFLLCGLRLDVGGRYSIVEETTGVEGADYEELSAYGRLSYAVLRHDTFVYGQYAFQTRDVESGGTDLDAAHEVAVGLSGVFPGLSRMRNLVGDAHVGYRWEEYGDGSEADSVVVGMDLTWHPSAYTSLFLAYDHTHAFSTIADFNEMDEVQVGVTHNLNENLVARVSGMWTRLAPEGGGDDSNRIAVGAGLRWMVMRNLDLTLDYEYAKRFEGAGFDEAEGHRISAGATVYLR